MSIVTALNCTIEQCFRKCVCVCFTSFGLSRYYDILDISWDTEEFTVTKVWRKWCFCIPHVWLLSHLFRVAVEAIIDSQWWESGFRGENGHHCHIFRDLVREHPELAHKAQDKCIRKPFDPCDPNAVTTYDFLFYEDNYYVPTGVYVFASSI